MNIERTQLIPRPRWENPRVRLLSDSWLLIIVAILCAAGVPWLASGFEVDFAAASWGLLGLGGGLITLTILESRISPHGRWRDRALTLLDAIGIIVIHNPNDPQDVDIVLIGDARRIRPQAQRFGPVTEKPLEAPDFEVAVR